MANTKISAMPNATTLAGTEQLAGVQSGANVNITPAQIETYIAGVIGTPALVLLKPTVVTSGSQTSVGFTSIPGTSQSMVIRVVGRSLTNAVSDTIRVQFNGDTGANYPSQQIFGDSNTAGANEDISSTGFNGGDIAAATATANIPGFSELTVGLYAGTIFLKPVHVRAVLGKALTSTNLFIELRAGFYNSTSAITSASVFLTSGAGFLNGSTVSLLGSL